MNELEVIDAAIAAIEAERQDLANRKQTKATRNKLDTLESKQNFVEQIKAAVESGTPLLGMYVSRDIGAEVAQITELFEDSVRVQYLDGESASVALKELMYDEKATKECPVQGMEVLVNGEVRKLMRVIHPGQIEVEGEEGLIAPVNWSAIEPEEGQDASAVEDESEEREFTAGGISPEVAPPVKFNKITDEFVEGLYRFLIGEEDGKLVGQLFERTENGDSLVIQTEPNQRYHWVRSVLVRKYHELVKPLRNGDNVSIKVKLLAFAPENQEAYHPESDEEDVSDIIESLEAGKGILQRISVSDEGEIYAGYRRALAAMLTNLEIVPIEVKHFDNRADFVEALFDANIQRVITPETKARVREVRYKYCKKEAREAQLAALAYQKANPGARPKALGSAWERTVADEVGVSASTASAQSKILKWAKKCDDNELRRKVLDVFNMDDKKTKTAQDLIEYSNQSPENAKVVADMILTGEAKSIPKAIAKAGLSPINKAENKTAGTPTNSANSIATAAKERVKVGEIARPTIPANIMRLVEDVLGDLDIEVNASTDAESNASLHLTGAKPELDALKVDWQLSKNGACTVFGMLYTDNTHDWARALQAQWLKGNISQAIVIFSKPELAVKNILKEIAAVRADIKALVDLKVKGKFYAKAELTAYYLGNDWTAFANSFDQIADVRVARWAFDPGYKATAFTDDTLNWATNSNGATASYKGMRLSVLKSADETWSAEIDGTKVAVGLTDESLAKTICASTADERIAA